MSIDTLRFLKMVAPEDPATWFTIHHRVFIPGKPEPIFPGNAHKKIRSAMDDAKYWANRGHCVYISQGMFRNSGAQTGLYPRLTGPIPTSLPARTYT